MFALELRPRQLDSARGLASICPGDADLARAAVIGDITNTVRYERRLVIGDAKRRLIPTIADIPKSVERIFRARIRQIIGLQGADHIIRGFRLPGQRPRQEQADKKHQKDDDEDHEHQDLPRLPLVFSFFAMHNFIYRWVE